VKHVIEKRRIIETLAKEGGRYSEFAYNFVLASVETSITMTGENRHISGEELLEGIRLVAARQFGPMAKEVLNFWGVYTTRDIGNIVFELIRVGLLKGSEKDSLEDFDDVFDFRKVFEQEYFETDPDPGG
jgi:uncharacterized repeat protein (TIGR04138 family)